MTKSKGDALHTTRYPRAPSILVTYPSLADWVRLYDPYGYRGAAWGREMHDDFRNSHERSVLAQLELIGGRSAGRAVIAEINTRSAHSIMILPFDFLPLGDWHMDIGAITKAVDIQGEWLNGVPMCGRTMAGKFMCFDMTDGRPTLGSGTGSGVNIFFTARRHNGAEGPDEVLLHELVHASRKVHGVLQRMPVTGDYGNQEEFLAVLVANIYRSEKGRDPLDYHGRPIDAAAFLDSVSPSPRLLLALLRNNQPMLFETLAQIEAPFNPVRQVNEESNALMRKIERM
jgi:hypothetical protein